MHAHMIASSIAKRAELATLSACKNCTDSPQSIQARGPLKVSMSISLVRLDRLALAIPASRYGEGVACRTINRA